MSLTGIAGLGLINSSKPAVALEGGTHCSLAAHRVTQSQLLYAAEVSSHDVGLSSVDFSSICEGGPIPVYEYTADGLRLTRTETPLSSHNHIFAVYSNNPSGGSQISLALGRALDEFINDFNATNIALIADSHGISVYDGTHLERIFERDSDADIPVQTELDPLSVTDLAGSIALSSSVLAGDVFDIDEVLSEAQSNLEVNLRSNGIYDVPTVIPSDYVYHATYGVSQGSESIGWAGSIAFIYNYAHGTGYTAENFADYCAGTGYRGNKSPEDTATYLNNLGLGGGYHFTNGMPSATIMHNHINNEHFIVASMYYYKNYALQGYHLAVIMGVSISTGIIGIHDSKGGDFYFVYPTTDTYEYQYWNPNYQEYNYIYGHDRRSY